MRITILVLAILSSIGCAANPEPSQEPDILRVAKQVETELSKRVSGENQKKYWEYGRFKLHKIKMVFDKNLEASRIGECGIANYPNLDGFRVLRISPDYWGFATDTEKEQLVLHELVHCQGMLLKHDDRLMENGVPASIMSTYQINDYTYKKYRDHYIDGAFKLLIDKYKEFYELRKQTCDRITNDFFDICMATW